MTFDPAEYEIIDAHTHPFLNFQTGCIGAYGKPETMEEFDCEMRRLGIRRYAGAPLMRKKNTDFIDICRVNEDALRIRDRFPAYIPGIHVHGGYPEESCKALHEFREKEDIRLIGEVVPYIMGTGEYNSPGMLEILKEAGKMGMTVNFHMGERETVVPVLEQCPGLKIILAHPGEPAQAKERFAFVRKYENLYMDISGTGLFRWNMLRYAIDCCGVEKMIFGSDMPTCSAGMFLGGVFSEHLTEEERKLVLAGNFKRLLGLQ